MNCLEVKPSSSATVSSVKDGLEFPITTLSLRHNVIMWVCMCVCVGVLERRGHILKWLHTATVPTLVCLLLQPAYKCERFKGVCSDRDNWNSLHCSLKKSKQVSWGGRDCSCCDQSDCLSQPTLNRWPHFTLQADTTMQHNVAQTEWHPTPA